MIRIAMHAVLKQYAAYNVWANHRITYHILQMPEHTWMHRVPSSFDSMFKTILHMWDAESIWWQRMRDHQKLIIPSQTFDPGMKDACNGLLHQSMQWEKFVQEQLNDDILNTNLYYVNTRGENYTQPVHEVVLHVFNHGTYHRGQLVTMMRNLGEANIPQTDYILFSRRKEKG
ncbi:MAG TPA: DinB family protein [Phnomibacter sp.]|nr:DinB family protein [Phnomibacter sp.]